LQRCNTIPLLIIITLIVLYIIDKAMKVRVPLNEEMAGQDKIEFDEEAYLE